MTVFDRVKELANKQSISIVELEEKLGFGRNSLYSWKKKTPNGDRLTKVADFFGVSTDYLLGREVPSSTNVDLEKALDNAMTYEGRPLTDEERAAMKEILKAYLKTKK
ncbi:helix-turn-helix domain-containing protein [Ligilactobacillus agilis]|uniref:helix-turn-helix domain-containing protein n=1 Tax=Ligilactobacillus agilis TaxID=1601 RepID=UPI003F8971DE